MQTIAMNVPAETAEVQRAVVIFSLGFTQNLSAPLLSLRETDCR